MQKGRVWVKMKNKNINMLIVAFLLLGVMSVVLTFFIGKAKEDFPKNIEIKENGITEGILTVRDLKLNPTESKEYSVNLVCAASGSYFIFLDYEETKDGGMKQFIDVTVKFDGEVVYEGGLDSLLDGDDVIELEGELSATEPLVITICYLMPYSVGNEAQGTYADFDIHFKIEKS